MISNYFILVLVHFVSDFFFQPEEWAIKKTKEFKPLLYHSIQYTIPFLLVFYLMNLPLYWAIYLWATHMLIDNRKFLDWWNKTIKGAKKAPFWLVVVQDQILHLLVLVPIII